MSKSVVTAAAAAHARRLGQKKLIKKPEDQNPAQDDQQAVDGKEEAAKAVQTEAGISQQTSMSDAPLGAFSFEGALAEASAGLAGEASAQDDSGMTEEDGDGSGTILLVGAVALAAAGIAVAASGGGSSNEAPVLADIAAKTTAEDTVLTFPVTATDPDGDALTFSVGSVTGGTATVANGTVTFTPNANFSGAASLVVTVTDSEGLTDTQTVNITVSPVADNPTIGTITAPAVTEDTPVVIPVTATDPDGGAVVVTVGNVTGGTATVGENGSITFTPTPNYSGPASFVVTGTDSSGATVTQTVNLTVSAVNDAPVITPIADQSISQGTTATVPVTTTDAEGQAVTLTVGNATNGTAVVNPNGTITFTPAAGFAGAGSFVVTATDAGGASSTQTVNVTVQANTAPVLADIAAKTTAEDTAIIIPVSATDAEGQAITFTATSATNGTAVVNPNGTITFTPAANFNGAASVLVTARDSGGLTDTQTVNITVTAVNDAPTKGPENTNTITTDENTPAEFIIDVLDVDTPDSGLTVTLIDAPDHGDITDDGSTYTPDANFAGTDSFTYRVSDGTSSYDHTVNVTVNDTVPNETRVSIDVGTPSVTITVGDGVAPPTGDINLDSGSFILTDDATVNTNVLLKNFGSNDSIEVDGIANRDAYSFSTGAGAGGADDLSITAQQSDGTVTQITIEDIIVNSGPIFSYETAVAALGFEFMTIA